jgi:DNA-directed RNA polymerase specialized sigma24 family protein
MTATPHKEDMNAVKIGVVDSPSYDQTLEAWYFHDRDSLLIGNMHKFEFNPSFSVEGTTLTEVTRRLVEDFDVELTKAGEALNLACEIQDVLSLKQSIIFSLELKGFEIEEISNITNLDESTVYTHLSRAEDKYDGAKRLTDTVESAR